jgi:hypothetical protein
VRDVKKEKMAAPARDPPKFEYSDVLAIFSIVDVNPLKVERATRIPDPFDNVKLRTLKNAILQFKEARDYVKEKYDPPDVYSPALEESWIDNLPEQQRLKRQSSFLFQSARETVLRLTRTHPFLLFWVIGRYASALWDLQWRKVFFEQISNQKDLNENLMDFIETGLTARMKRRLETGYDYTPENSGDEGDQSLPDAHSRLF